MSVTRTSGELRIQIETLPSELNLELQDPSKTDVNPELTDLNDASQERIGQAPTEAQIEVQTTAASPTAEPSNQQSISLIYTSQLVNLPLDPPPYSEFPVYTIPVTMRGNGTLYDPPPPYDPSMRRETFDPVDFPYQNYQQNRSSRFECKPDTLIPLGFCYCTLEQLIVTLAILGTFLFLGLGQFS